MPSLDSFLPCSSPGVPFCDHERRLAPVAERRIDGGHDHVDVGDPAVGDEDLGPVEDPLVAVELGGGPKALDVRAGLRLRHRIRAELDLLADAEALGNPAWRSAPACPTPPARPRRAMIPRSRARSRRSPNGAPRRRSRRTGRRDRPPGAGCARFPSRPHSRAALITSHGVDSSASCSAAAGRITSAANRRQSSLNSRCSSLTPKSILCPPWVFVVVGPCGARSAD